MIFKYPCKVSFFVFHMHITQEITQIIIRQSFGTFSYDFVPSFNDCRNLHVMLKFAKQYCVTRQPYETASKPLTVGVKKASSFKSAHL